VTLFVNLMTNLTTFGAQRWWVAVAFGALLAIIGGAFYIGFSELMSRREARRHKQRTLAHRLRLEVAALQNTLQEISPNEDKPAPLAVLGEVENLFLMSRLVLPQRDAQPVIDFFEGVKLHFEKLDRTRAASKFRYVSGSTEILDASAVISDRECRQLLEAADLALTKLRKY
jgi:hypothetical protein